MHFPLYPVYLLNQILPMLPYEQTDQMQTIIEQVNCVNYEKRIMPLYECLSWYHMDIMDVGGFRGSELL